MTETDDGGHFHLLRALADHQTNGLPCLEHRVRRRFLGHDLPGRDGVAVLLGDVEQVHAGSELKNTNELEMKSPHSF